MKTAPPISVLQSSIDKIDHWRYEKIATYCKGKTLDVACGLEGLSHYIPTEDYTGCDLNGGQIKCSADRLPFEDNDFDTVVLAEVLEHLQSPFQAIQEATRVAKKNIIITVPNDYSLVRLSRVLLGRHAEIEPEHIFSYNSWNLMRMLEMNGFTLTEYFSFPLRLQLLPEIKIKSRFGYWLFVIAEREN